MQLEGSGKIKKFSHLTGSWTHNLPACSLVSQPLSYRILPLVINYSKKDDDDDKYISRVQLKSIGIWIDEDWLYIPQYKNLPHERLS
jgi:hypothetical protein